MFIEFYRVIQLLWPFLLRLFLWMGLTCRSHFSPDLSIFLSTAQWIQVCLYPPKCYPCSHCRQFGSCCPWIFMWSGWGSQFFASGFLCQSARTWWLQYSVDSELAWLSLLDSWHQPSHRRHFERPSRPLAWRTAFCPLNLFGLLCCSRLYQIFIGQFFWIQLAGIFQSLFLAIFFHVVLREEPGVLVRWSPPPFYHFYLTHLNRNHWRDQWLCQMFWICDLDPDTYRQLLALTIWVVASSHSWGLDHQS